MFNPQARWDRNLPTHQSRKKGRCGVPPHGTQNKNKPQLLNYEASPQEDNQAETLNEPIAVSCFFSKAKLLPRYFIWRNKLYKVKKVNFFWQQRQGREMLSYFSLETNGGTYQVSFSNISLSWKMNRVFDL